MARLGPWPPDRRVHVAVSGGGDSMALALLLSRWGSPRATIVEHGLRPEAAAEAAQAASCLALFGVPSMILAAGLRTGPRAAERARDARYRLLLRACLEAGLPDLLLAHHALDQAETVQMRREAGSGADGLAGMAAITYRHEVRIVRPLLGISPARLRATLVAAGIRWIEDPTNADQAMARIRIRRAMTPVRQTLLLERAASAAARRAEEEARAAEALACVEIRPEGFALVAGPLGPEALSALIWSISGAPHPPPRAAMRRDLGPATVHGVQLSPAGRLGPGMLFAREPAAVDRPVEACRGALWDGRFKPGFVDPRLQVGALGADATRLGAGLLPARVRRTLPAIRDRDGLVCVPHLNFPDPETCRKLPVTFAPRHVAAGAPFR